MEDYNFDFDLRCKNWHEELRRERETMKKLWDDFFERLDKRQNEKPETKTKSN